MMNFIIKNKKTIIFVIGIILVILVFLFGLTKMRVVGTWRCGPSYSDYYACTTMAVIHFNDDGTYTRQLYEADSNSILYSEKGVWKVSFLEVRTRELGETGYAGYVFNPLTVTLKNDSHIYKKIS